MKIPAYIAVLVIAALAFFLVRKFLGIIRFSARLLMGLVLLLVVVAATLLSGKRQHSPAMPTPEYQTRQPTDPLR